MIGWIGRFHQSTMEKYRPGIESEMVPWKKKVMQIHQDADFLFYVDEMENSSPCLSDGNCLVRGELVKGNLQAGSGILLLNGEGELLAKALIQSDVEEKEDKRKGLLKRKRNEFDIAVTYLYDMRTEDLEETELGRHLWRLYMEASLIMEDS